MAFFPAWLKKSFAEGTVVPSGARISRLQQIHCARKLPLFGSLWQLGSLPLGENKDSSRVTTGSVNMLAQREDTRISRKKSDFRTFHSLRSHSRWFGPFHQALLDPPIPMQTLWKNAQTSTKFRKAKSPASVSPSLSGCVIPTKHQPSNCQSSVLFRSDKQPWQKLWFSSG